MHIYLYVNTRYMSIFYRSIFISKNMKKVEQK